MSSAGSQRPAWAVWLLPLSFAHAVVATFLAVRIVAADRLPHLTLSSWLLFAAIPSATVLVAAVYGLWDVRSRVRELVLRPLARAAFGVPVLLLVASAVLVAAVAGQSVWRPVRPLQITTDPTPVQGAACTEVRGVPRYQRPWRGYTKYALYNAENCALREKRKHMWSLSLAGFLHSGGFLGAWLLFGPRGRTPPVGRQ
jgi:hypothetical protein